MDMQNIKAFDFKRKPKNPNFFMSVAKHLISWPDLKKREFTYDKIHMEGLKPPFLLLSTHSSMVDFNVMLKLTHPYRVNNVMTLEGFHDYTEFVMRNLGVIGKRKFIQDIDLIRNIRYSLRELKNIFVLYPEARYSLDGTTSFLPESLGKLCKSMKVPVVVINLQGNFVTCPQWNKINKKSPVHATMTQIITADEILALPEEEVMRRIRKAFVYDDFKWQLEHKQVIDHPKRAEGLHSILYQCANCGEEFHMYSGGTMLWCTKCDAKWEMTEYGSLKPLFQPQKRNFTHIPDWFAWERENIRAEVEAGTYHFEDEVRIDTLPNAKGFRHQPNGMLRQDVNGTTVDGTVYGKPFRLHRTPLELESMHVEYDYHGWGDCVDISTAQESYWCYPIHARDVISKLSIATEEIQRAAMKPAK